MMPQTFVKKVSQYKEDVKKEAENLLLTRIPSTILELNILLTTPIFRKREFGDMREYLSNSTPTPEFNLDHNATDAPPTKRVKYSKTHLQPRAPSRLLKSNKYVTDLIVKVKPHLIKLIEDVNMLKMWIRYLMPKKENGNNFGVAVQEEILKIVQKVQDMSVSYYERVFDYYDERARIIKTAIKHPSTEDYYKTVLHEFDEKEYLRFCFIMVEIKNNYCRLHDIFTKNLEKLKKPRSRQPIESLY